MATSCDKGMHRREQLLITVDDGLPHMTEMKSMKSLKRGQWMTEIGRTALV